MFTGCILSLFVPLLLFLPFRPFTPAYDWELLFMQARYPRPSDPIYSPTDTSDLGSDYDPVDLRRASYLAKLATALLFLIFLIIIPFSLYGSGYIFSKKFFLGWTIIVFLWSWCAALYIWIAPIWEARESIGRILKGIMGKNKKIDTTPNGGDEDVVEKKSSNGSVPGPAKEEGVTFEARAVGKEEEVRV